MMPCICKELTVYALLNGITLGCTHIEPCMDCMKLHAVRQNCIGIGENWLFSPTQHTALAPVLLKFCFHYCNTHVKQYAGTLFDCIMAVVHIYIYKWARGSYKQELTWSVHPCVHTYVKQSIMLVITYNNSELLKIITCCNYIHKVAIVHR